jgi:hypothetical protein
VELAVSTQMLEVSAAPGIEIAVRFVDIDESAA